MVNVTQCAALGGLLALACAGCKPELEGRPSLVQGERVLAIQSAPAEAKPGVAVHYAALYVDASGVLDGDMLDWALCNHRKGLAESGTIAHQCLFLESPSLDMLGMGSAADGTLAREACETFGPTPPTPKPGEPSLRPVDPDTTGGFYQPVRVLARGDEQLYAVGMTRLTCALGGATPEQSAEFNRRSRPNENPQLDMLELRRADGLELPLPDLDDTHVLSVDREERVTLTATWTECPLEPSCGDGICSSGELLQDCPEDCTTPHGCSGAERYVYFDPQDRSLKERRESLRVSWFASAGHFEHERTGQSASDTTSTSTKNVWIAPEDSRDVLLWIVIRDDRGGVGWRSYKLRLE
jgi:hypothetical protein